MATWDGSYPEPDGSSFYVNSFENNIPANGPSCDYYVPNPNNVFSQSATPYTINSSLVYNQSIPSFINSGNRNEMSVMQSMAPAPNVYVNNDIPINHQTITGLSEMHYNDAQNQLPTFHESSKPQNHQKSTTQFDRKINYYNGTKPKVNNKMYLASNIVENSNLHATASEFIPNQNKQDSKHQINKINRSHSKNDSETLEKNQTYNHIFFENNKPKYNDRRFENKRDAGRRWRDNEQDNQSSKDDKKDYSRNQNFKKFQNNDRHNHGKNYSEKPRTNRYRKNDLENVVTFESNINKTSHEEEKNCNDNQDVNVVSLPEIDNTKSYNSASTKNTKFSNNGRNDRFYDRKDKYNPKDPRDRKSNYSDYNVYNKNNYNRDENGQNRNNYSRDDNGYNRNNYNREDNGYNRNNYNREDSGYNRNNYNREDNTYNKSNRENKYEKKESRTGLDSKSKDITDWRQKTNPSENKAAVLKRPHNRKYEPDDDACQKERLTELLNRGQLECLVCCEFIRQADYTWSCRNCYHVLHLKCVKKWATSSQDDAGWRCPACQNVTSEVPSDYYCFCGKTKWPEWNRRDTAHSCGEICGRSRPDTGCVHKCTLLCHPGSCPPCLAMVTKQCGCGRTSQTHKCSSGPMLQCDTICDRDLNCGIHKCETKCHHGSCESCNKIIKQECYCGNQSREVTCILDLSPLYSCENVCNKTLDCGNHKCIEICHPGECKPCLLKPENVTHCCCGQSPLTIKRETCLDTIPTCDKVCSKRLKCGQPSNPHICQANCHEGDCPPCEFSTKVKCRCGYMDKEIPCRELTTKADDARCEKKCTKKRSCGKHKCNQMCCIDIEHICPLPCLKNLSCGRHKCEQTCHKGRCQTCWRSSFDELYCECGAAVIYPPVACGTRPPPCVKPCTREHSCDHEALHNCHSDPTCPPCTVLTQKWCYGKHELRKSVPCYVNEISCGLPCAKPISCGRHKCIQVCHDGPCEKPNQLCVQPCTLIREACGHICNAPCHDGKCPDIPCRETVKVTCQCGNRTMSRMCAENTRDYQRIASGFLASKMAEMQLGHSVDLEEVFGQGSRKQNQLKTLECNEECKMIERNRRLTLGLQIVNPDLTGKLMPRYSEAMKQCCKKDPTFCQMVHDKLTELVQLAKTSKQKSRSYSFEVMNREKRAFVHELCEHFGCESQAYDQEPKRNVVATAVKDKCWLPSYSLVELLQRESGQRKVPKPMLNVSKLNSSERNLDSLQSSLKKNPKPQSTTSSSEAVQPPEIDYFNYTDGS